MSGEAIIWLSKKQRVFALSTTEAEYVALEAATQEVVWLRRQLSYIKASLKMPTVINEDNCSNWLEMERGIHQLEHASVEQQSPV